MSRARAARVVGRQRHAQGVAGDEPGGEGASAGRFLRRQPAGGWTQQRGVEAPLGEESRGGAGEELARDVETDSRQRGAGGAQQRGHESVRGRTDDAEP